MLVSIVIPCYHSEHTIEKVADLCFEEFSRLEGYECELVLVNDYSKDDTLGAIRRCAEKYPEQVTGVNLAKNFGQHAALMAGFHYVRGDLVVGMDDDLQNHPAQIPLFLQKMREGYDVVFGVYKQRRSRGWKKFYSELTRFLLWHLLDRPKGIDMSNFWLARRFVIDEILSYEGSSAFVQLLFFRTTHNIADIEIEHYDRQVGESNYTFRKGLKLFLSFVNYSIIPLRLATYLGVLCSVAGVVSTLAVFIRKMVDPDMMAGWPSLMCVILLLFGFMFCILGILGEYLGKVVLSQNKEPQYVVREVLGIGACREGQTEQKELPPVEEEAIRRAR